MSGIPTAPPRFIKRSIRPIVIRAWGREYAKPEEVYQFSGGRPKVSTDRENSGVYRK